jgi:hypothetical protein
MPSGERILKSEEVDMKSYIKYAVILVLVVGAIGVGRNNAAWAGSPPAGGDPSRAALPAAEVVITDPGLYTVGGLCTIEVAYNVPDLRNVAAVDVPAEVSRQVPYSYPGELYLAGCHLIHYDQDKVVNQADRADGEWEVCFGDRPDEELTIYYYLDDPAEGRPVWRPLPTVEKDGFVCAPAIYTGVYAPGGFLIPLTGVDPGGAPAVNRSRSGTVRPPAASVVIPVTGRYSIGGICTILVEYYAAGLSNEVHVEENMEISYNVPFPDNQGILYLPGCHVFHYKQGDLVDDVTTDDGRWTICFAAIPERETTIFYYFADDEGPVTSEWTPLETTVENGMACAPLTNYTAVYAPAGK